MGFRLPSTLSGCKPRREATGRALGKRNDLGKKSQQLANVRARRLTPQSTAPTYLPTESVRDNASSEAEGIKGSTFFYILRTSTKPDFSTSRRGIRLILFIGATRPIAGLERSAVSGAPSQYLGPLWLPASFTLNAFAQICAKVRKWDFPYVSRAWTRIGGGRFEIRPFEERLACAREAMSPFLNNGTTFTTCKPIAPQRPRPSVQSPKPPRIARAKLELGARSRAIKPVTFDPPLPRARGLGKKVGHPTGQTTIARPEHGLET